MSFKDTINPYNSFLKNANFSVKTMSEQHPISLNSQFTVVFNDIICFSVRFRNNSLSVLKDAFSVLYFYKQKGSRIFQ